MKKQNYTYHSRPLIEKDGAEDKDNEIGGLLA
jgi:hypothetical protein